MYCITCGASISDTSKFCIRCGAATEPIVEPEIEPNHDDSPVAWYSQSRDAAPAPPGQWFEKERGGTPAQGFTQSRSVYPEQGNSQGYGGTPPPAQERPQGYSAPPPTQGYSAPPPARYAPGASAYDKYPLQTATGANVWRAFWVLAAGLFLAILVAFAPINVVRYYSGQIISGVLPLVLGLGFYIASRNSAKFRIIGCAGLVLIGFLYPLAYIARTAPSLTAIDFKIFFVNRSYAQMLMTNLVRNVIIAVVAIVSGIIGRKSRKLALQTWIAATFIVAVSFYFNRTAFVMYSFWDFERSGTVLYRVIFDPIVIAVSFFLAALLARMTAEFKGKIVRVSTGARVWCIIAAAVQFTFIAIRVFYPLDYITVQTLLIIPAVVGLVMLAANLRVGYVLVLIGAGFSVMSALARMVPVSIATAASLGFILSSTAIALITWATIARSWRR